MQDTVVFEWTFSPADYFDQELEITQSVCVLRIAKGRVTGEVAANAYDADPNYRMALHGALNLRFRVAQCLSHRPYTLSLPSMTRVDAEGRRHRFMFAEPGRITVTGGNVDFIHTDKDPNIISSTRRDRQQRLTRAMGIAATFPVDTTLNAMLKSYDAAVHDPKNELIHLFEILEAIEVKFGTRRKAMSALGIVAEWPLLGRLANDPTRSEGRHRGEQAGASRNSTAEELSKARSIARDIIEGYLSWLDTSNRTG